MFFVITALAAVIVTIAWYVNAPKDTYRLSLLGFIFWGATLMWLVDHVMAYLMEGGEFFEVTPDAALLGANVVLLGLVVWLIVLLVTDPKGVFRRLS
ncbi:MAG: hypothetical protein QHH27_08475 [Clostridia bacterium]|jgi:hypothetical protein|nr:hypothetical protein [Clostridia bacterium]MDH7573566.1 hypothetical protein [Clostridia bacterium]